MKNTPAFPGTDGRTYAHEGMTLRDYFAGVAISTVKVDDMYDGDGHCHSGRYAERAYDLADSMLKEKEKRESL